MEKLLQRGYVRKKCLKTLFVVLLCVAYNGEMQGLACKHVGLSPILIPTSMIDPTLVLSQSLMSSVYPNPNRSAVGLDLLPTPVSMTLQPSCYDLADLNTDEPDHIPEEEYDEDERGKAAMSWVPALAAGPRPQCSGLYSCLRSASDFGLGLA